MDPIELPKTEARLRERYDGRPFSDADRQRIEAMSEALVNKLLHDATLRLKAEASNGHAAEYAAAVRHLR